MGMIKTFDIREYGYRHKGTTVLVYKEEQPNHKYMIKIGFCGKRNEVITTDMTNNEVQPPNDMIVDIEYLVDTNYKCCVCHRVDATETILGEPYCDKHFNLQMGIINREIKPWLFFFKDEQQLNELKEVKDVYITNENDIQYPGFIVIHTITDEFSDMDYGVGYILNTTLLNEMKGYIENEEVSESKGCAEQSGC